MAKCGPGGVCSYVAWVTPMAWGCVGLADLGSCGLCGLGHFVGVHGLGSWACIAGGFVDVYDLGTSSLACTARAPVRIPNRLNVF
jgi:hypothetical protein